MLKQYGCKYLPYDIPVHLSYFFYGTAGAGKKNGKRKSTGIITHSF